MKVIVSSILIASIDEPREHFESSQILNLQENNKIIDGSSGNADNLVTIQSKDQPIQIVEFVESNADDHMKTANQSEMT